MSHDFSKNADGEDLPFLRGARGYREIFETLATQGKDKPPIKDLYGFCRWLGAQRDMQPAIDLVVERETFDMDVLQPLLELTTETAAPLTFGVL